MCPRNGLGRCVFYLRLTRSASCLLPVEPRALACRCVVELPPATCRMPIEVAGPKGSSQIEYPPQCLPFTSRRSSIGIISNRRLPQTIGSIPSHYSPSRIALGTPIVAKVMTCQLHLPVCQKRTIVFFGPMINSKSEKWIHCDACRGCMLHYVSRITTAVVGK